MALYGSEPNMGSTGLIIRATNFYIMRMIPTIRHHLVAIQSGRYMKINKELFGLEPEVHFMEKIQVTRVMVGSIN